MRNRVLNDESDIRVVDWILIFATTGEGIEWFRTLTGLLKMSKQPPRIPSRGFRHFAV